MKLAKKIVYISMNHNQTLQKMTTIFLIDRNKNFVIILVHQNWPIIILLTSFSWNVLQLLVNLHFTFAEYIPSSPSESAIPNHSNL